MQDAAKSSNLSFQLKYCIVFNVSISYNQKKKKEKKRQKAKRKNKGKKLLEVFK